MATLTHAESKRLYSWWWSSHISPKNSKWLQENLTDVDGKVKAMIKLIEEDADSFAKRAEMYYKKRPELMKMVEEFYRAYRALAERYDNAMGELRQAHRTMADAFSNQIPFLIPEESLSASSQSEPQTPVTPHPIRSLLDSDDHPTDNSGSLPQSHMIKRAGAYTDDGELYSVRKGLKQFKNIFSEKSIGSETSSLTEEISSSDCQEAVLKEEVKKLQDELSKLSSENQNLASRILLVTERSDKVETEVQSLRDSLSTLETEKASAIHRYEQSLKKVSNFEAENFQERTFTSMLSSFEERCCFLESSNQSLQSKIEALLHKAVLQDKEIGEKQEELEKLYSSQEEALHSLERLRGESEEEKRILGLELGVTKEKLEEVESLKRDMEQQLQKTKEDNFSLQKHYLSSNLMIKNLQDEILNLKEAKSGLEDEVTELISKESALQQQLSYLKDDMEDLGRRHQFVIDQIESVGFNAETFHLSIKELQDENSELKSVFIKEKNENLNFLNKLGEMEKVSAKSSLLESSLTDANNELEVLREKLDEQADSFRSLQNERVDLLSQNNTLISQVDHIAENLEKISVKNSMLENSLFDLTVELNGFRVKSKCLEESIQALQSENSSLLLERDNLITHVETIQSSLKDLERNLCETEKKNSCLNEEKELAVQQISELEVLLAQKKEEHSLFAESNNSLMANLKNLAGVLQEEVSLRTKKLEEEEEKHLAAHTEVLILRIWIIDMKQQNDGLFGELHMHNKTLLTVKNHVSKLQEEVLELKEEMKQMEETNLKQRVAINQISRSLGIETFDEFDDDIEDHIVLRQLSGKIESLKCSLLNSEDEIELLLFERSIDKLILKEMRHEDLNMKSEKERSDHNLVIGMEEISFRRTEAEKLLEEKLLKNQIEICLHQEEMLKTERETLSSQLSEACKAQLTLANENYELLEENQSWKKEFCFLRDEKYILEEEYTTLLKEALSHHYLYLIFEKFSCEKATELRELNCEVEKLQKDSCDFKEVFEMTAERMKEVEFENVLLKETVVKLEGYRCQFVGLENELLEFRGRIEELNGKIVMGKQLLSQKEIDLSNALMIIEAKNRENIKLRDDARALQGECCEAQILIESLQGSLNLVENKARHDEKQYMKLVGREEWLVSELKRNISEVEIWEAQAVELYEVLQNAEVTALVYQQKVYELAGKCESLQMRYMDQMKNYEINKSLVDAESEKMKSKLFALELENEGLRQEVTVDLRRIMSLKDGIIRLEEQALSIKKFHDKEIQIHNLGHDQQSEPAYQNGHPMKAFELLNYLEEKIDSAVNALLESKAYLEEESAKAAEQLETAKMEMEVLKGRINMMQGEVGSSRNARLLKDEGDISHIRMKDIQLDQVSDRSSPRLASDVYAGPIHQIEEVEPFRFEKSSAVDKIESSRLSGGTQGGSKRILEKLEMDAEKLTNIQASVFDTQNRIKRVDKDKLTSFEHDSFMTHLREIEGAISQLFDMKGKLQKNADEESLDSGRRIRRASERGLSNRRQSSEQVRRWSEKIARMELEVQQIRFLLFKLEEEYDMKKKKTMERRVQLRDYLYGGTHDSYRKKKRHLCACIEPMAKED